MRYNYLLLLLIAALLFSCKKDKHEKIVEPPLPAVLIKDIVIPNLPSPYYHFEYNNAGKVSLASFASGFFIYDIAYNQERISVMQNITAGSKDRLQYYYDSEGRVNEIKYVDEAGILFKRSSFFYNDGKLIRVVRERKLDATLIVEKTTTLSYYEDGNLFELKEDRPEIAAIGQPAMIYVDRFSQYDNKVNADAFGLLHPEFFEHFVMLPDVRLQKNNPGKLTRTGDGVNYEIDYTYTFNEKDLPLTKRGDGIFLSGTSTGQRFQTNAVFSYY